MDEYERLVDELCKLSGANAAEVLASGHIMIDKVMVGLARHDKDTMSVIIDLGKTFPDEDGKLYHRMLVVNAEAASWQHGHFCIHAESARAAWRHNLALREIPDGKALAQLLDTLVREGQEAFEDVLTPGYQLRYAF